MPRPTLLIATRNPGKMREYRQLLREVPFELVSLEDLGITADVEETGSTFHENARLKASAYAALCRGRFETCPYVLADDSGLEVDALGGEPGVRSARYGETPPSTLLCGRGDGGIPLDKEGSQQNSDADRVRLLLRKLEGVPWERRTARFRCVVGIAIPPGPSLIKGGWGDLVSVVGSVAGMIQYSPLGNEGFGYDPVFYLPSFQLTMAQLPLEEKNRISHRSDAARKALIVLKSFQQSAISH